MTHAYTIAEIARAVEGELDGSSDALITGVADVATATESEATFVSNLKYAAKLANSHAGVALVSKEFAAAPMPLIRCARVDRAVAKLLALFAPEVPQLPLGIHPTAVVDPTAIVGANCAIGPHVAIEGAVQIGAGTQLHAGVCIGYGTTIGKDCVLWRNVTVFHHCEVGDRVEIHSGSVIGADGFGYYFDAGRHHKVPHIGGVRIGDDVEIGACCCVDRSKFGFTVVGRGTKIDNFVQIAHNVHLGEHCLLAGHTGLGGSVRTGDYCVFGGRSGSFDNVNIGTGATVAGGSLTAKDVPTGMTVSGVPAQDHRSELRQHAALRRLPELLEEIRQLRARVEQLENAAHHRT